MKRSLCLSMAAVCCVSLCGCATRGAGLVWSLLLLVAGLLLLGFGALRIYQYLSYRRRRQKAGKRCRPLDGLTVAVCVIGLLCLLGMVLIPGGEDAPETPEDPEQTQASTQETTTEPPIVFAPEKVTSTDPANWGITWEVYQDGVKVDHYQRAEPIFFGQPEEYFQLPGIATFRGDNYRNTPVYRSCDIADKTLSTAWTADTGTLAGGVWSGSGWTGQPLIVQWDEQTRAIMTFIPVEWSFCGESICSMAPAWVLHITQLNMPGLQPLRLLYSCFVEMLIASGAGTHQGVTFEFCCLWQHCSSLYPDFMALDGSALITFGYIW